MNKYLLGIDIGGTYIKSVITEDGNIIYDGMIETVKESADALVSQVADICRPLIEKYGIEKVGIGVPGVITDGLVRTNNLPISNYPFGKNLSSLIGIPVNVENDANCAALAEVTYGDVHDNSAILVAIGTGVGGGIIIDGKILSCSPLTGEVGHIVIHAAGGRKCSCGLSGCLEQYASSKALANDTKTAALENKDSLLYSLYEKNREGFGSRELFIAMREGCPVSKKVFDTYISDLAAGINSMISVLGIKSIILAGGITNEGEALTKPLEAKMIYEGTKIYFSKLKGIAGAVGASLL